MKATFQHKSMLRSAGVVAATLVGLSLAGCSSAPTYGSPEEVTAAFVEAGGTCSSPSALPDLNAQFGIYGFNCESGDAVLWFKDGQAKSDWLDLLADTGESYVVGSNWLIMTSDTELVTKSMGGSAAVG